MKDVDAHQGSLIYLRFLRLLDAIRSDPDVPKLDHSESVLLEALARHWFDDRKVNVVEMMNSGVGGMSQSTVHRRLKSLRQRGMVVLTLDGHDNRLKYVEPTPLALQYLDRLGTCVLQSKSGPVTVQA